MIIDFANVSTGMLTASLKEGQMIFFGKLLSLDLPIKRPNLIPITFD